MNSNENSSKIMRLSLSPDGFGSVVDELSDDMFTSEMPTQHTHLFVNDEEQGLYVGVWDTDDMTETAGAYPCDEFMVLLEGEARIKNVTSGTVDIVRSGEGFVLPKGFDCQWKQQGYLKKFFMISEHPNESIPDAPSHNGVLVFKGMDCTPSPNEQETEIVSYTDSLGRFTAGTWYGAAYSSPPSAFPVHQLCYVHSGSITLTETDCASQTFSAGETFYIPINLEHSATVEDSATIFFCRLAAPKNSINV